MYEIEENCITGITEIVKILGRSSHWVKTTEINRFIEWEESLLLRDTCKIVKASADKSTQNSVSAIWKTATIFCFTRPFIQWFQRSFWQFLENWRNFPISVCSLAIFVNSMSIEYLKKLKIKSEKVENTAEENPYKRTWRNLLKTSRIF